MRVLIVDDHEVIRRGLRTVLGLRKTVEICGEAADGKEAVDKARELKPDLVILDINMPGMDGFAALKELKAFLPGAAILFFSMHGNANTIKQAMAVGAQGFVSKDQHSSVLLKAIDAIALGETFFPS